MSFLNRKRGVHSFDIGETMVTFANTTKDHAKELFSKLVAPAQQKGLGSLEPHEDNRLALGMTQNKTTGHYDLVMLEYNLTKGECIIKEVKEAGIMKHHAKRKFDVALVEKKITE